MAPMALLELERGQRRRALPGGGAARPGWIFGDNELGREMLDRDAGILYRSIRRRRGLDRALLYANTAGALRRAGRRSRASAGHSR